MLLISIPYLVLVAAYRSPDGLRAPDQARGPLLRDLPARLPGAADDRLGSGRRRAGRAPLALAAIALPVTYLLAFASWHGLEKRALRLKHRLSAQKAASTASKTGRSRAVARQQHPTEPEKALMEVQRRRRNASRAERTAARQGRTFQRPVPRAARARGGTVLVTGGAGYIGAILTERLLERGYNVRVLDRLYWGEKPLERRARPHRAGGGGRPRHPRHGARRRGRRDPPGRPLERPDRRVRPRGQLADERRGHRGARQGLRRARRGARGLLLLLLPLRRAAARNARRERAGGAARRLLHLEALRRAGAARRSRTRASAR